MGAQKEAFASRNVVAKHAKEAKCWQNHGVAKSWRKNGRKGAQRPQKGGRTELGMITAEHAKYPKITVRRPAVAAHPAMNPGVSRRLELEFF
jgi:hypothetical protein